MAYTCLDEIASGPSPELSLPLSDEELDDLWFYWVLDFSRPEDISVTQQDIISATEHLLSNSNFNNLNDTAFTPTTTSMGELTDVTAQSLYKYLDVLGGGPTSYPAVSSISATAGSVEIVPATASMSDVARRKRCWDAEDSYGNGVPVADVMPPQKRVRGGPYNGNLEAAWSGAGTHRRPDTRVPTNNNDTSKKAGRGTEGLATPNVQGVYHRSLLGPSSQQGWVVTTAQGQQLPGIEGRVEESMHHTASTERQEEGHLFEIPSDFEGFDMLLAATEADWTRRAVNKIKCRLCPHSEFNKWDVFKRHCRTTEAHPLEISFCEHCGDFFARSDSLTRHLNRPPVECLDVTQEMAEEKRRETQRQHRDFIGRVERSLTTGEEITSFAQIIKRMYPGSSKKRTGSGW